MLPLDSDDDDLPLTLAESSAPALELDTRSRPLEPVDDVAYNHIVLEPQELEPEPIGREEAEPEHVKATPPDPPTFEPSTRGILGLNDYATIPAESAAGSERVAAPEPVPEPMLEPEPAPEPAFA